MSSWIAEWPQDRRLPCVRKPVSLTSYQINEKIYFSDCCALSCDYVWLIQNEIHFPCHEITCLILKISWQKTISNSDHLNHCSICFCQISRAKKFVDYCDILLSQAYTIRKWQRIPAAKSSTFKGKTFRF